MIYVITGAPCSGKSTYVREHAKDGDMIVDLDEITKAIGIPDHDYSKTAKPETLWKIREALISDAIAGKDNFDSWIIDTMLTGNYPKDVEIILLDVDKETAIARAKEIGRPQRTFDGIDKYFADEKGNIMSHLYKSFELKAKEDETGLIAGFFSTYDETPDSYGDIVRPGAFTETIKKRLDSGHPFPLCFNHDFSKIIGYVTKIEDTEKGPYIEAKFLDTQLAQDVRKMLQSGAIYQFSFAYDVLGYEKPTDEQKKAGIYNILTKLEVFEISVVTVPANQNAVVTEVKSAEPETKAGRRNSQKDADIIKQIRDLAQSLLDDEGDDNTEEAEAKSEEAEPEVNEASEEQKDNGNSKRASDLLEKINSLKGGS